MLFAPDVVEREGKYYLYAYIANAKGRVAVSDRPEGPFKLLSKYEYSIPNHYDDGTFIDPGVLVDHHGRVYIVVIRAAIWRSLNQICMKWLKEATRLTLSPPIKLSAFLKPTRQEKWETLIILSILPR